MQTQNGGSQPLPSPNYATGISREDFRQEELRVHLLPDVAEEVIVQAAALGAQLVATPCKFTAGNKRTR